MPKFEVKLRCSTEKSPSFPVLLELEAENEEDAQKKALDFVGDQKIINAKILNIDKSD